jgi:hypothetical protein
MPIRSVGLGPPARHLWSASFPFDVITLKVSSRCLKPRPLRSAHMFSAPSRGPSSFSSLPRDLPCPLATFPTHPLFPNTHRLGHHTVQLSTLSSLVSRLPIHTLRQLTQLPPTTHPCSPHTPLSSCTAMPPAGAAQPHAARAHHQHTAPRALEVAVEDNAGVQRCQCTQCLCACRAWRGRRRHR